MKKYEPILYIFLLSILLVGLKFHGAEGYEEVTPLVLSLQGAEYLETDPFVLANEGFSVRTPFVYLVIAVDLLFNNLDCTYITIYITALFVLLFLIYKTILLLKDDKLAALLTVITLSSMTWPQVGGCGLVGGLGTNIIAYIFVVGALYLFLRKNHFKAFLVLGFTVWFQLTNGIILYLLFATSYLLSRKLEYKVALNTISYFVTASPLFILYLWKESTTTVTTNPYLITYMFSMFTHEMHALASSWDSINFIYTAMLITIGYILAGNYRVLKDKRKTILTLSIILFIIAYLGAEVFSVPLIAKLMIYPRIFVFLASVSVCLLVIHLYEHNRMLLFFYMVCMLYSKTAILCTILIYFLIMTLTVERAQRLFFYLALITSVMFALGLAWLLPVPSQKSLILFYFMIMFPIIFFIYERVMKSKEFLFTMVSVITVLLFIPLAYVNIDYTCDNVQTKSVTTFLSNFNSSQMLIVPPSVQQFRLCGKNPVYVDLTTIYTTDGANQWIERLKLLAGVSVYSMHRSTIDRIYHDHNNDRRMNWLLDVTGSEYFIVSTSARIHNYSNKMIYKDEYYEVYEK